MKYRKDPTWNDGVYIFKELDRTSESDLERAFMILPEYRLEKVKKCKRDLDRKNCVIAYLLLTIVLKREFSIKGRIAMDCDIHGKPYSKEYQDVYSDFSRCSQGVVCAVSINDIGVDIETIDEKRMFSSSDIFSSKELEFIINSQKKDFFRLQVLKEVTVKCIGIGLVYGSNYIELLAPKDGTFCKDEFVYYLKKIGGMYLAVCSKYPVRYQMVTRKELLNI